MPPLMRLNARYIPQVIMTTDWQNRIVGYTVKRADQLTGNPRNPRRHPQKQRNAVKGSLDSLGWIAPVLENVRTGYLIDGHERVMQALGMGDDTQVPVIQVDLDEAEEAQALATFDFITYMAEYDRDNLDALLRETNSDNADIQALLAEIATEFDIVTEPEPMEAPEAQIDRAEELLQKWNVQRGDLWIIGEHRLLCGDSTSADDVARVMGGERADAVVTDPPYGQNQAGVTNDEPEKLPEIVLGAVKTLPIENAIICAFQSPRTFPEWLDVTRQNGIKFERMLWMYKAAQMAFPWRGWILKSESILISSYGNAKWVDVHPYAHDCYYMPEVSSELPANSGWHGSVKPLHVVSDLVSRICNKIAYDPFGGSGTTMVACEQLQRKCRMIEIEPKYCAVILERMSQMGLVPEKAHGETRTEN